MPILTPKERLGTKLADKYRLDRVLGKGGMGVVFEALHEWTERPVAVKLLYGGFDDDRDNMAVKRFLREAKTAAKLKHPNVVDVLDMGQAEDGSVFLVLELLDGEPLDALLEREKRLSAERTLELMLPVVDALRHAHSHEVTHRDMKPENIFLSFDTRSKLHPKLLDFGIAKVADNMAGPGTTTGTVIGTPHYMSPEQAHGAPNVGPPSDVWSTAVVLFECLTGELPFEAETMTAMIAAILMTEPKKLHRYEDVPPNLARVIDLALSRDPLDRFADAGVFLAALADAANKDGLVVPGLDQLLGGALGVTAERALPEERDASVEGEDRAFAMTHVAGSEGVEESTDSEPAASEGASSEDASPQGVASGEEAEGRADTDAALPLPGDHGSWLKIGAVVASIVLVGGLAIALQGAEPQTGSAAAEPDRDEAASVEIGAEGPTPEEMEAQVEVPAEPTTLPTGFEPPPEDEGARPSAEEPVEAAEVPEPTEQLATPEPTRPRPRTPRPRPRVEPEPEEAPAPPRGPERGTNAAVIID